MTSSENKRLNSLTGEITLKDLISFLKEFKPVRKAVLIACLIPTVLFVALGYIAKITSTKEFESTCVLYSEESQGGQSGSIQALALLAGIKGTEPSYATGGDLYQLILTNKPFLLELSQTPIPTSNSGKSIFLGEYFTEDTNDDAIHSTFEAIKNFPKTIVTLFSGTKEPIKKVTKKIGVKRDSIPSSFVSRALISELTGDDKRIIAILSQRIKLVQNGKLSTLQVKMPDPVLSAEANKVVLELLLKYAIRFKASKQLENVEFLEKRVHEAEVLYKESQQKLAKFKDTNFNVVFQSVQAEERFLESNFALYSGLYSQLVGQLEQARIQLKKDSPLFTIVEPVYIPDQVIKNNDKIFAYFKYGFVIGFLITGFIVFKRLRIVLKNSQNSLNENNR
ncbi:MAG: hypothetical protein FJZ78_01010 [Bacteroidetes bacterium]|nr:hypothetical protein [Bacteroidota bacterium]